MIRQVHAEDWKRLRDARLRALAEAPYAFLSKLADERAFPEEVWRSRAAARDTSASFAVEQDDRFDGIVSCFFADAPGTAYLVAMWVSPKCRGAGLGRRLVEAVVDWARAHGAARVVLSVERGNAGAFRLYERCGFTPRDPPPALPYDPGAGCDVMVLDL